MKNLIETLHIAKEKLIESSRGHQEELKAILSIVSGTVLEKYTFSSGKKHERLFFITPDLRYLSWRLPDSNRKLREIAVSEILDISEGNTAFSCKKSKMNMKLDPPEWCFSIHTQKKVINVVCHTDNEQQSWVLGLNSLKRFWNKSNNQAQDEFNNAFDLFMQKIENSTTDKDKQRAKYKEMLWKLKDENRNLRDRLRQSPNQNIHQRNKLYKTDKEDISYKSDSYIVLEQEYEEFKKQIKESFSTELNEKMKKYKNYKQAMGQYANELKIEIQDYEKEVSLWQAVVYHFVLPSYQAKNAGGSSGMPDVLKFALDTVERKFNVERVQHQFISVISNTRRRLS